MIEVQERLQITIPAQIVKSMGIKEGDKFEVIEKNGSIFLSPVVIYLKRNSELKVYDDFDQMFEEMGIHLDET